MCVAICINTSKSNIDNEVFNFKIKYSLVLIQISTLALPVVLLLDIFCIRSKFREQLPYKLGYHSNGILQRKLINDRSRIMISC